MGGRRRGRLVAGQSDEGFEPRAYLCRPVAGAVPGYPYAFDRVAHEYDRTRTLPAEAKERIITVLSELAGPDRVLEVGVGTGRVSLPLQKAGLNVVGVDVSRAMLRVGAQKGLANIFLADAAHLPFADASFRLAMSHHVLHLLPDWRAAVSELARVSRLGCLSLIDHDAEEPDIGAEYHRLVEADGGSTQRPGLPERDLARRLPAERTLSLGHFRQETETARVIDLLERRLWSSLWSVPARTHEKAIAALRVHPWPATVRSETELTLAFWSTERLRELSAD